MGSQHLRVFKELSHKCKVAAFAEADPHRRDLVGKANDIESFSDYNDMIHKVQLDAVSIALPNEFHAPAAIECFKNGIDVMVEKPIALNLRDASRMIEASKRTGRILMVGHVERFNPVVQFIRKYVEDGGLGDLYYLSSRRLGVYPARQNGGKEFGVTLDLAIHDVDAMRFITGRRAEPVHRDTISRISRGDDYVSMDLRFGDAFGHIEASWLSPFKVRQLVVNGRDGIALLDYMAQTVEIISDYREKPEYVGYRDFLSFDYEITKPAIRKVEPLKVELNHFLDCVRSRSPTISDGMNGLENLKVVVS